MILASFKGNRSGLAALFSIVVRWWLGGRYSHTELIFSDGLAGSSSAQDGGVRLKRITFDPDRWDFIEVDGDEAKARQWFEDHAGQGFDYLGLLGFVWRRSTQVKARFFCSESVAAALGFDEPHRMDPCTLPTIFKRVK
jgi:hypothetical protein